MSLGKKLLAPLRNAFSYAVHMESAADYARKPDAVEKLIALSPAPENADDAYATRLRAVLMKTRTKHLDTLIAYEVRVMLDSRLPRQRLGDNDQRIDGIFYDQPGAKTVALWDDGKILSTWSDGPGAYGPVILEKLSRCLDAGMTGDMFASRYTAAAHTVGFGGGIAAHVSFTDWMEAGNFKPGAVEKNPALRQPLKKREPQL